MNKAAQRHIKLNRGLQKFEVDLPLVHCHNTRCITTSHLVSSREAGKSCTETVPRPGKSAVSWPDKRYPEPMHKPNLPCSSKKGRQGLPRILCSLTCQQESRAKEPAQFAPLLLPTHSSLRQRGLPWDLAGSFFSCYSPKLAVTCETRLTWKSSPAELSGKINTSREYVYLQTS